VFAVLIANQVCLHLEIKLLSVGQMPPIKWCLHLLGENNWAI